MSTQAALDGEIQVQLRARRASWKNSRPTAQQAREYVHFRDTLYNALRPEPQQANPKRPPEPRSKREWCERLIRAHRHVSGTRWAADLNPDWKYDVQQFKEAEDFIRKAESAGYVLSARGLAKIDAALKARLAAPIRDNVDYGARRVGRPERYAIRIVKQSCRWWLGNYEMKTRSGYLGFRSKMGMTKLEMMLTCLRWGTFYGRNVDRYGGDEDPEFDRLFLRYGDPIPGTRRLFIRYGDPVCPHCGHKGLPVRIKTRSLWKCKKCRAQFNVWTATPFQGARLTDDVIVEGVVRGPSGTIREFADLGLSKFQAMRMRRILSTPDDFLERVFECFVRTSYADTKVYWVGPEDVDEC